jgi:hypothetical protein
VRQQQATCNTQQQQHYRNDEGTQLALMLLAADHDQQCTTCGGTNMHCTFPPNNISSEPGQSRARTAFSPLERF